MNFNCCGVLAPYPFDFFYEHSSEPLLENILDGSTDLSIGITIVLRERLGKLFSIQACKLCRAPQRA